MLEDFDMVNQDEIKRSINKDEWCLGPMQKIVCERKEINQVTGDPKRDAVF